MSDQMCRYPCGCDQFDDEHCACMDGHRRCSRCWAPWHPAGTPCGPTDTATALREKRETLPTATMVKRPRRKATGKPSAARQRRVSERSKVLREIAADLELQGEANLSVGWDDGPEQAAWLRALADAASQRPTVGEYHRRGVAGCRLSFEGPTESPNCWCPRDSGREAGK